MISLKVVSKRSGDGTPVSVNEVFLKEAAVVRIGLSREQVKGMRRVGNDLVITSISGEVVTIREFFSSFDGHKSDLVLDDEKGGLWLTGFGEGQGELALDYSGIDAIEPLLLEQDFNFGVLPWLLGGGLAVAGAAGGGGGGGGGAGAGSAMALIPSPSTSLTSPSDASPPGRPTVNPTNARLITGTAQPGTTVRVTDNTGKEIGSATVEADGRYVVQPSSPPPHGTEIRVVAVDSAGNTSPEARTTVDSVAPPVPTIVPTNGTTIAGSAEPGAVVTATDGRGNVIGRTTAAQDGSYVIKPPTPLADRTAINVVATDAAGNASAPATTAADSTAPSSPTVHPSNGSTITGTAEAGAVVTVKDGSGKVIGSATAASNGAFSVTPTTPPADGATISVVAIDPAGNASQPATATIDATPPATPKVNPTDGSPITGTAEAGAVVTITDDKGVLIGSTTAASNGVYSFTPTRPPANGVVIKVVASDAAGNTSKPATAVVDGTPPTPTVNLTKGSPITGTSEPDSMVTVTDSKGNLIGSTTTAADGTYSLVPANPPSDGTVIYVVAKDLAGNVGRPATTTVDSRPPDAPLVNATNGSVVAGTAEANSVVTVKDATGKLIGSTTADAAGKFSVAPAAQLADGTVLHVTAADAVGNVSAEGLATVDRVPPAAPSVDPTHGSAITGRAEPGSVVTVRDVSGNAIGSATVGSNGFYSVVPKTPPADGAVLRVTATDAAGNTGPETRTTVDGVPPARPTVDPTAGSLITGSAEPGSVVTVRDGAGTLLGSATADSNGRYSINPTAVPSHNTVLRVVATDPAGNDSPEARTTVDSLPPSAPTVDPSSGRTISGAAEVSSLVTVKDGAGKLVGSATADANGKFSVTPATPLADGAQVGVVATDAAGNASSPTTMVVDGTAPLAPVVNPTDGSRIAGTAESGAVVTVKDAAGKVIGSATADANGKFSIVPTTPAADGTTITAVATDRAGNASQPVTTTVDSTPPARPSIDATNGSLITGTAEQGAIVTIRDGAGTLVGSAVADSNGRYGIRPATVPSHNTVLRAVATDAAGNASPEARATVDSELPAAPKVDPTNGGSITGTAEAGSLVTVKDGAGKPIGSATADANGNYSIKPTTQLPHDTELNVTATDAAGNTSQPARSTVDGKAPDAPKVNPSNGGAITGTSEAGSVVTAKDGAGKLIGSTTADANGKFSITPATPLADGTTITAVATDRAGNASQPVTITVDGTPPAKPSVDATNGSLIAGSAELGSIVTIRDGAGNLVGSAAVDSNGRYSIKPATVPSHNTVLRAVATDAAGNTSPETRATVDSELPAAPKVDPTNGGSITGTAEAGSVVAAKDGAGTPIGSATADANGNYSIKPTTPLAHDTQLNVTATDAAGNTSQPARATVDGQAPDAPTVKPTNGSLITGTAEAGSVVTVKDGAGKLIGSATADGGGAYAIRPAVPPSDGTVLHVSATDAAGNTGPSANATVDAVPPGQPSIDPTNGKLISGFAEALSVVTVRDGAGNVIGSTTAAANGAYSIKPAFVLADGTVLRAFATDAAGNASSEARGTVDGVVPVTPTISPTNGNRISGKAEAGSIVTVKDDAGNLIGSATAESNGTYTVTPATPPAHGTVLHVASTDAAGNTSPEARATVDRTALPAATINPTDGSPITGTAEPGSVVTVRDDAGKLIGSTTADSLGAYSLTPAVTPPNGTVLHVVTTNAAGNASPEATATVDSVPPPAPIIEPSNGNMITGTAEAGSVVRVTDDTDKLIGSAIAAPNGAYSIKPAAVPAHGTVLRAVATDAAGNASPEARTTVDRVLPAAPKVDPSQGGVVTGTAEVGSVVRITDDAGKLIGSATAGNDGTYSIKPSATLPNGTVMRVTATDAAGNVSPETRAAVDSVAPAAPIVKPTNGNTVTGTAEAGSLVTVKDGAGNAIGSATADGSGNYSVKPATAPAHDTVLQVTATDAAGNISSPATAKVDAKAPDAPTIDPTHGDPITGRAEAGSVVTVKDGAGKVVGSATAATDGTYSVTPAKPLEDGAKITVVATDAAGNASAAATATVDAVAPGRPTVEPTNGSTITGKAEAGSVVTVQDQAGKPIGSATADGNGNYAIKPATPLAHGTTLGVSATDAAGNTGPAATATVDSAAPNAPTVKPTSGDTIAGTAEAGSVVTVKDAAGNLIGSATADGNGNYAVKPATPPAHDTALSVTATDAAGNSSAPATAKVDNKAPDAPTVKPTSGSTIAGTAEAGSLVTVRDGTGNLVGSATAGSNGEYAVTPARSLQDGVKISVVATDAAGNASQPATATVDNDPPARPTVDPTNGSLVTGKAEAGSVVTITDDAGKLIGSTTATTGGAYSFKPTTPPAHGTVLHVAATDAAGNSSPEARTTVNAVSPSAPAVNPTNGTTITGTAQAGSLVTVTDGAGNTIGSATADGSGNYSVKPATAPAHDTVLQVTATDAAGNISSPATAKVDAKAPDAPTIDPTHGDPITGRAEAGSVVTVKDGAGKVVGSATVATDGTYSVTPAKPLEDGAKITAVATDAAGNASAAATATVDAVAPGRPTVAPTNGASITGTAESGSLVTVKDSAGKPIGSATADANGNYTVKPATPVPHGTMLGVSATDAAGNTGPAATATVDSAAPNAPTVKPTSGSTITGTAEAGSLVLVKDGSGNSVGSATADGNGNYVVKPAMPLAHDTALSVTATDAAGNTSTPATAKVDSKAPDAPTVKPTSGGTVAGTAEAGSVVTVRDDTGNLIGSATAGSNGEYSISPTAPLPHGTQLRVVATDATGNTSQAATATVDSVAPVISIAIVEDANNDGFINASEKKADVTVKVTLVSGAAVGDEISLTDGTHMFSVKLSAADVSNGFANVSFPNPAEGATIRVSAISQDLAGNTSRPAATDSAILDTTVPATPASVSATDDVGPVQGAIGDGGSTDDATPTFAGSGATPGDIVRVYDGAALIGSATVKADGSWAFTPTGLGQGAHSITHTISDAAGNTSAASAPLGFIVDTAAVSVIVTKAGETRQGQQIKTRPAGFTDDVTPTVVGTATAGAVVTIKEGSKAIASTTADGSGNWNLVLPTQAEGAHSYKATAVNAAGTSSETSFSLTIDTTPPAVPVIASVVDDTGSVQGALASGAASDDTRPTLSGSGATPGDLITVFDNGSAIGSTTVQSDGRWSFTTASPTSPLGEGEHKLTVTATDPVGNQSQHSAAFVVNVDTTAPVRPDAVAGYVDDAGAVQNAASTATFTDDTTPGFKIASIAAGLTPSLYVDGNKVAATYDPTTGTLTPVSPLAEGAHSIGYTLTDAAGNESPRSNDFRLTVDLTPPPALDSSLIQVLDDVGPVQGPLAAGAKTDDSKPEYTGKTDPAQVSVINVYDNGALIGSTAVNADGSWRFTPDLPLALGAHSLTARAVDAAGNIGAATPASTFTLVGDPPAAPAIIGVIDDRGSVTGNVARDASTDDTTLTLNGTGTAGTVVTVYADGVAVGSTSVASNGTWSVTTSPLSGDGVKNLSAQAVDGAGQASPRTGLYPVVLDTTAPATPDTAVASDDQGPVQGAIAAGATTDDTTPTFSGGGLKAGDTVRLYDGGALIGSFTAATDGAWSITPSTPLGRGTHRITHTVTDAAGNTSAASAVLDFTVDPSDVVVSIEQIADDQGGIKGNLAPGARTDDTTPSLVGKATAGAIVTVKEGSTVLGSTTADAGGNWRFTLPLQKEGTHSYTATAVNAAGKQGDATIALTIDTTAPEVPSIAGAADDVGLVQGPIANGGPTDDATPTLTGSGATPGDVIKVYDNGSVLGSTTVKADGSWSFTPTTPLIEGTHRLGATAVDPVGNESPQSGSFTVNVDTTAPTTKATLAAIGDDTGSSGSDFVTSDRTLVFTIKVDSAVEAGAKVQVSLDNGKTWNDATPSGGGSYQFDNTAVPLADGSYTVLTRVVDAAGNTTQPSSQLVVVDTSGPTTGNAVDITAYTDDVAPNLGDYGSGTSTNDTTPVLKGTVSGLKAGDVVQIFEGSALLGTAAVNGTAWTFALPTLANGSRHTYVAVIADAAGNKGTASADFSLAVNTAAPSQSVAIVSCADDQAPQTGTFASGSTINDTSPLLNGTIGGTLNAGDTVVVYRDGVRLGTATLSGGSAWTFQDAGLVDGKSYSYTARIEDAAGNQSGASAAFALTIDQRAPTTVPVVESFLDDVAPVTGSIAQGGTTNDARPELKGSGAEPDGTVRIYDNGTLIGTATADAAGKWSFTPEAGKELANGAHSLTTSSVDAAGNEGPQSAALAFTVDTLAPSQSTAIVAINDDRGALQGAVADGGFTDDAAPQVAGTVSAPLQAGEKVVVLRDGAVIGTAKMTDATHWSFDDTGLSDGRTYTYTARVEDAAGNRGAVSGSYAITVDTSVPTQAATISTVFDNADPVQGDVASGGTTNDSQPELRGTVSGSLAGNEFVAVYRDGVRIGTASISGTSWSYTDTSGLANASSYSYTVRVEDAAGGGGTASSPYVITLKLSGPSTKASITAVNDDVDPQQGSVPNDGYTNDTAPQVTGTISAALQAGEKVVVLRDGKEIGFASMTDATHWSYADSGLSDGSTYVYTARVQDAASNPGAESNAHAIRIDTAAPAATVKLVRAIDNVDPVSGDIPANGTTNDDTPTLEGTLSAPLSGTERLHVFRNGLLAGIAKVTGTAWTFEDAGLASGTAYTYEARVMDAAGNAGAASNSLRFTVNTSGVTQTVQILRVDDQAAPVKGNVPDGGTTNDTAPTLGGSISTVLNAGDVVEVLRDGKVVGNAAVTGTTWSFRDTGLSDGTTYSYAARVVNSGGNEGAKSAAYAITLDLVAPSQAAAITGYTDDQAPQQGSFASGSITNDTTPQLNGTLNAALAAGEAVVIYRDGKRIGTATMAGATTWSFQDAGLSDGATYSYTAKVEDAAGNEGQASAAFTLTIDRTAPAAAPSIDSVMDATAPVVGPITSGSTTNETRPQMKGAGAEPNGTVKVYDNDMLIGTAVADGSGKWSFTPEAGKPLANGAHSLSASSVDAAGNEGPRSAPLAFTVGTTAPTQAATITAISDDTGASANDFITSDTTLVVTVTLDTAAGTGEKVQVSLDNGTSWRDATLVSGNTYRLDNTAVPLAAGDHVFQARVVDAAGNAGKSSSQRVVIDTQHSAGIAIDIASISTDTGVAGDFITSDTSLTLNGRLTGTLASDETAQISVDGGATWANLIVSGGNWSYVDGRVLTDGSHEYRVRVVDTAGNLAALDARTVAIDTSTPTAGNAVAITAYADDVDPNAGDYASGTSTNDTTPVLKGTVSGLKTGEVVQILEGGVLLGTAAVNGTAWEFKLPTLADGSTHTYTAAIASAAGTRGTTSANFTLTVDAVAPSAAPAIDSVTDNVDPVQGPIAQGDTSNDARPELKGSGAEPNGTVNVYDNGVLIGSTKADASGKWSFEPASGKELAEGVHSLRVSSVDAAGNEGPKSAPMVFIIDTVTPSQTVTLSRAIDNADPISGSIPANGSTNDDSPRLEGTLSAVLARSEQLRVFRNGVYVGNATVNGTDWVFDDIGLSNGTTYTYEARVIDMAGNAGAASNSLRFTVITSTVTQTAQIVRVQDNVEPDRGAVADGGTTNDADPVLIGSISAALNTGEVVEVLRNGAVIGTATVTNTSWRFFDKGLTDGATYKYTARVVSAGGNQGAESLAHSITVDLTAPVQKVAITDFTDDRDPQTGNFASGTTTNDATPQLNGTLSAPLAANEVVAVYRNGTRIGVAAVSGNAWSFEDKGLDDGNTYRYTARVEDAAGNQGSASAEFTLTVDRTAPATTPSIDSAMDDVAPVTGAIASRGTTNDARPELKGSGAEPNGIVHIYDNGTLIGTATADASGNWSFTPAAGKELADGLHRLTARNVDAAGNEGSQSTAVVFTVDTIAPTGAPSIDRAVDDVAPVTGAIASGGMTNDARPELKGAGTEPNGMVNIYDNGKLIGSTTADSSGKWSFTPEAGKELVDGAHSLTARNVDAAGNEGPASAALAFTVDTVAPSTAPSIDRAVDDVAPVVGGITSGGATNDARPDLGGSGAEPNGVVKVYDNGTLIGSATADGSGKWSFTPDADKKLADGAHSLTVSNVDSAGNEGPKSAPLSFTVDTKVPATEAKITGYIDDAGSSRGTFGSGTTTDDANPVLTGTLTAALGTGDTVNVYEGSTLLGTAAVSGTAWTYDLGVLADGSTHTYRAAVATAAGTQGSLSGNFSLTVDYAVTVNRQTTVDTTPLVSGGIPFKLVNGQYLEVTIAGKTYSSADGSVVVDSQHETWYVQVSSAVAVGTYDVRAVVRNAAGAQVTDDATTGELIVAAAPTVTVGSVSSDPNQKATAYTLGENGMWRIHSNQTMLDANGSDSASLGSFKQTSLFSNYGSPYAGRNYVQNATFMDFNRDGYMDLFAEDSTYDDGQQAFIFDGSRYTALQVGAPSAAGGDKLTAGSANTYSWFGGVVAFDKTGDGFVDMAYGDQTPNDATSGGGYDSQIVLNMDGSILGMVKDGGYTDAKASSSSAPYSSNYYNATFDMELSGVDLNNDGKIDLVYHATAGTTKLGGPYDDPGTNAYVARSTNQYRLVVATNKGDGTWENTQIIEKTFQRADDDPGYGNGISMTWADFNGDGYMDLFLSRGYGTTTDAQYQSRILFNDGAGKLKMDYGSKYAGVGEQPSGMYLLNDSYFGWNGTTPAMKRLQGGPSIAVDWNGDGKMDAIELPGFGPTGGQTIYGMSGPINLYTNTSSASQVKFDTTNLLGGQSEIGFWNGSVANSNLVTGAVAVDIDWDGDRDLLAFTQLGTTKFITNTNTVADGTSLHFRILDAQGINALYGNTVQLFDSKGKLVSTQMVNPQSGNQTNDSSAIVDFYGLDASETYTLALLRIVNGKAADVGGADSLGGNTIENVNNAWTGLKTGAANHAFVLTAESGTNVANADIGNGIVGTGYNDTFFATLGNDKYEGGGGTVTVSGVRAWSNTGGLDVVDYKLAGSTALTIDLSKGGAQNTGFGTASFRDIEGLAGGSGADVFTDNAADNQFEGRGGNDVFNLTGGGRDTLLYKLLASSDATGGNGADSANSFTVGTFEATANADRIDLRELLVGYQADADGAARYINGVATIDAGETIGNYLRVDVSGGNTTLYIDRDGSGAAYSATQLITLNGVTTDLATLLANHQLVLA
ncbi:BapA prefix-like domain-containing protein [Variovorax guangxiensis]|uniref:BapA prefix-like domain-containing protein n=1 Tax=Variovorax guangxiensis TaxID=1775474 RepID=A0A433MI34_9BURK|nr:Ig-like domain-containing protein [Variovorax guangxiensis]RUR67473.1 BapA prefix-like domain-containing protein [Variovorax guangxiensis]